MEEPQLHRTLTWVQGTAMAIGAVLGSGVLIFPAITAEQSGPASTLAWLAMSLLAVPLALTIGRLGARYPNAGGIVEYARLAFGSTVGRITGWLFLGTIPIGVPIIALVGADYVASVFALPHWTILLIAPLMLALSLYLNLRGIDVAGWVQVMLLAVIALLLIVAILAAMPHVTVRAFHPLAPHGWMSVGTSAVVIFWCFIGWEMVAHLAEEFRNPSRDLRRTFTIAPAVVGVLYVALSVVTVGTHAYGSKNGIAPLSLLVGIGLGPIGSVVTGGVALLITMVAIHGNVAGFSRMVYAQARQGDFPAMLGKLHTRYQTPVGALTALGVDFVIVLTVYTVFKVNLGELVKWPSVVFLVLYMIAMASAVRLLKGERWSRWMALIPLVVCAGLYPFSGWACVYPILLGLVGWLVVRRKVSAVPMKRDSLTSYIDIGHKH
ncbi:amino acid permease [Alicyclobacillaceae bacterium I2511]|nr:amino acid permease [Alicyclobacillaceae bacterium I2511]